jgi:drug/metabolite transporter (DMT)-like permease
VPWSLLVSGIVGFGGHEVALAAAFQSAPPTEATLLNYLWPLFLIVLNAAAERKPLNAYLKAAACLGFAGVIILLSGRGLAVTGLKLCFGHLWTLISAITCSVFSVTCYRQKRVWLKAGDQIESRIEKLGSLKFKRRRRVFGPRL